LARPEAEGAIGNSTVCTLFDGADVTFDFRHVLILIATFQVQRERSSRRGSNSGSPWTRVTWKPRLA
jgi:hypothetical protein